MNKTEKAASKLNETISQHRLEGLPLGLHFDLHADRYHADKGLGSGDIKRLARDVYNYWWFSWMNPMRPEDEDTPARLYGRALHACILEGRDWFEHHYACGPDQRGMSAGEKSASTREANKLAAEKGKDCLKKADYESILFASSIVTSNPDLARAFTDGRPEVSFIWLEGDVRMKMRVDYLKAAKRKGRFIAGIGDLKSVGADYRTDDFVQACYNAIDDWDYHVQAAHYINGAMRMRDAIREGCIYHHGSGPREKADLDVVARLVQAETLAWQWVFYAKSGPPRVHSMVLSPGNELLKEGFGIVERGVAAYREWMEKKGPGEIWTEPTPVHELEFERMPRRSYRT